MILSILFNRTIILKEQYHILLTLLASYNRADSTCKRKNAIFASFDVRPGHVRLMYLQNEKRPKLLNTITRKYMIGK